MTKKKNWDDILPPEGLGMDWEYKPSTTLDKRSFSRLTDTDISRLFAETEVLVRIATGKRNYVGRLLDISEGGLLLSLSALLEVDLPLKIGFILGKVKVLCKAVVRHCCKSGEVYMAGIQFIGLNKESAEYIAGLYASMALWRAR